MTSGSAEPGEITNGPVPGILKSIVSAPGLLERVGDGQIAWRSEPGPLSFVLVT